ncbi:MAG TPA: 4-hydroxythreonine-4-phosphate dehydrogenase PdxA [Fibrobacteria bacterium]|nr:4-hydroxythreonine-4-phosphate dehydrogenase PdxA [Fibrobacteria bacterium]HOX50718.1 4-hydroxythreonine-4-phosphate dehydrogenase PdxA [Fibrobacteria bacterium]
MRQPILITLGDPNGVGPRTVASLFHRRDLSRMGLVVVGEIPTLSRALAAESVDLPVREWTPGEAPGEAVSCLVPSGLPEGRIEPGTPTRWSGAVSLACVDLATDLCMAGKARAMVTAPLAKEAVDLVLPGFSGHTGHIARRTGAKEHCLSLVHGKMWAAFVTTHIALRDVPGAVSTEGILSTTRLLHRALVESGTASPRIGIAGLNPHAGEHGLFGDEEGRIVEPAVAAARSEGMDAIGPLPADVVFPMLKAGRLDGVVSLYHDQGHPVMKTLAFDFRKGKVRGVNATLGLPIVRTSPDHGTGFDIAWRDHADNGSLVDALRLAHRMSSRRVRS